MYPKHVANMIF